jgi:hypothetical protein
LILGSKTFLTFSIGFTWVNNDNVKYHVNPQWSCQPLNLGHSFPLLPSFFFLSSFLSFLVSSSSTTFHARPSSLFPSELVWTQTVGRTVRMGGSPVTWQLPTQKKCGQISIPRLGFASVISVFERARILRSLEYAASMIGSFIFLWQ